MRSATCTDVSTAPRLLDRCRRPWRRSSAPLGFRRRLYRPRPGLARRDRCCLIALQRERPEVICLRGNHEAMMLEALRTATGCCGCERRRRDARSYRIDEPAGLPPKHVDWVAALPLSLDDGAALLRACGRQPAAFRSMHRTSAISCGSASRSCRAPRLRAADRARAHAAPYRGPRPAANRLNIDTAAVYGGPLTAAIFTDEAVQPVDFLSES